MFTVCTFLLIKLLLAVYFCYAEEIRMGDINVIEFLPEIYETYKQAAIQNKENLTRRLFKNNDRYMLHIQKLKEVNGIKTHNVVVITTVLNTSEPLIYVNNPVESHIPYAFLTREQFKNNLINNIKKQQQELERRKIKKYLRHFKMKPTRTEKIVTSNKLVSVPNNSKFKLTGVPSKNVVDKLLFLKRNTISKFTTNKRNTIKSSKSKNNTRNSSISASTTSISTTISESTIIDTTNKSIMDNAKDQNFWILYKETLSTTPTTVKDIVETRASTDTKEPVVDLDTTTVQYVLETSTQEESTSVHDIVDSTTVNINVDTTETSSTTETTEVTSTMPTESSTSTKSTRKTRGRPFVFMG